MITYEYDQDMLAKVEKKLGSLKSEAPTALKNAINKTAKQARKDLASEAQKTYTVKSGGFNKAMKIKNASAGSLEAVIKATGAPLQIKSFRISKAGDVPRVQVLKAGSLKPLVKGNIKAFVNNIARKGQTRKRDTAKGAKGSTVSHTDIAQRKGSSRLPIKTFYGNSVPIMLGNERRVYGIVKPTIEENLQKNVDAQVAKILGA